MPVFTYRGLAADGRTVSGLVDADSPRSARLRLREQGIFPTELTQSATGATRSVKSVSGFFFRRRVPAAELALATRQLSTLLAAGFPLVDALAEQTHRALLKSIFSQVREKVREGSSLADALSAHGQIFSNLYVNMVRAGETA